LSKEIENECGRVLGFTDGVYKTYIIITSSTHTARECEREHTHTHRELRSKIHKNTFAFPYSCLSLAASRL